MLEKRIGKEKLQEVAEDLNGYILGGVSDGLSKNERLALASQLFKCLTKYIKEQMHLPVTLNTIITSFNLLEHAVEQEFPGYATSRLLRYTIMPVRQEAR